MSEAPFNSPEQGIILHALRRLLENEELARLTVREYFDRQEDLGCQEYIWTIVCTL